MRKLKILALGLLLNFVFMSASFAERPMSFDTNWFVIEYTAQNSEQNSQRGYKPGQYRQIKIEQYSTSGNAIVRMTDSNNNKLTCWDNKNKKIKDGILNLKYNKKFLCDLKPRSNAVRLYVTTNTGVHIRGIWID